MENEKKKKKRPIISYGILAFKKDENIVSEYPYKLLLVQRTNTMAYSDFIRGRYFSMNKDDITRMYMTYMTPEERHKLLTMTFDELWDDLWINHKCKHYINDKSSAKKKYHSLNIKELVETTNSKYMYPEFGIPKGRKNRNETNIACAIREFYEETGYNNDEYTILDINPLIESFVGTNNIDYKHIYYIAIMKQDIRIPEINPNNDEIKYLGFYRYEDIDNLLRDYDIEKKKIIKKAFESICNLTIEKHL